MSSSDDEGETVPEHVSEYQFLSSSEDPISFTVLPLEWNKGVASDRKPLQVFLRGEMDNGLLKIYKQVTAWKYDLSYKKPEISVLTAEGHWIKLLKPWNPYNDIIRTVQITLGILHFAKWNAQQSQKALLEHLNKNFSFEKKASVDELGHHLPLVYEAVERDKILANSKILSTILEEKPWERGSSIQWAKPSFIVDDISEKEDQEDDDVDDIEENENDCFDHVCAICDNGGDVVICDGKCMRSFHQTEEDGEDSNCESLGLTEEELRALQNVPYICENCKYKEHQCFACGKLGSSDDSCPEVFCCVNGTCGYFYHPHCVAKLLHPGDSAAVEELEQRIGAGEQFVCPSHTCHVCKDVEVKSVEELQFAVCRRCPRAYHRKCLPREIMTEENVHENGVVRAWEGLIPNRLLIYCLSHKIDPEISTPSRDHIKFPERGRKMKSSEYSKKRNLNNTSVSLENYAEKCVSVRQPKKVGKFSSGSVSDVIPKKRVEKFPLQALSKMKKVPTSGNLLSKSKGSELRAVEVAHGENETIQMTKPITKRTDYYTSLDGATRSRILSLMKEASSSVTLDQVKQMHASPSTHSLSKVTTYDLTLGKAEGTVKAIRAALRKMDEGYRVQDAQAVCGVDLLSQVPKWRSRLKVYLSPFLYGMRYTSFGRHFTKPYKLKEIVDILHWYVQDGDMLVDFCCGSNDFSCLMKKKLDEMGKSCSFKNYDIVQAKDDFNFERRDWMGVKKDELPDGSKLIMGLNPPFGVKSVLANKFINKALEFKPKLLILIVPHRTKRLDEKEPRYDLIWEDDKMFLGKSFYLPGSVDVNDNQLEDWNKDAPPLYLWSRPDWTAKHKAIAEQHGHSSGNLNEMVAPNSPGESKPETVLVDEPQNLLLEDTVATTTSQNLQNKDMVTTTTSRKEGLPREGLKNHAPAKGSSHLKSKGFREKGKRKKQSPEDGSEFGKKGKKKRRLVEQKSSNKFSGPRHPSPKKPVHSERDDHQQFSRRISSGNKPVHMKRGDYQQFSRRSSSPYQPYTQKGYSPPNNEMDDVVSRYYTKVEESHRPEYLPIPAPNYGLVAPVDVFLAPLEPNPWNQRAAYPTYNGPPFPSYGERGTSAMQRYAPRLDEMNHASFPSAAPSVHLAPPQTGIPGSTGFAPRPSHHPYSQHNSSGWLHD